MSEIPRASVGRLMKEVVKRHKIKRISSDAVEKMSDILEEIGMDITKSSVRLAKHAKRNTVNETDVKLSLK